jgi:ribosome-associated protein
MTERPKAPKKPARQRTADPAREFAIGAARLLSDDKCDEVIVLDVRKVSPVSQYIVIGSGTSERQMRSALIHVEELGAAQDYPPFHSSKDERATWLLADFVHVVVHVFEPNTRAHYDLEMLWGDAERLAWERPTRPQRTKA